MQIQSLCSAKHSSCHENNQIQCLCQNICVHKFTKKALEETVQILHTRTQNCEEHKEDMFVKQTEVLTTKQSNSSVRWLFLNCSSNLNQELQLQLFKMRVCFAMNISEEDKINVEHCLNMFMLQTSSKLLTF